MLEKELRLKQTMRMAGVSDADFLTSWWLTALLQFTLIGMMCTLVASTFLTHTSVPMLFAYIATFCAGMVSFSLLLASFFSNAVLAAVCGPIAFFGCLLPRYVFFGTNRYEQAAEKRVTSLLLPSAFAFGASILADYEYSELGVSLDNWTDGEYSFATSLFMMALDALLYAAVALYCECVPCSCGRSRPRPHRPRMHGLAHAPAHARTPTTHTRACAHTALTTTPDMTPLPPSHRLPDGPPRPPTGTHSPPSMAVVPTRSSFASALSGQSRLPIRRHARRRLQERPSRSCRRSRRIRSRW